MKRKFRIRSIVKFSFLLSVLIIGCERKQLIHFYSIDRSQCITVIDVGDYRYVIDGKHKRIPEYNFIKLEMRNIDRVLDGVHICWENKEYTWEVVIDKSIVVESKLDTSKFTFNTSLPLDDRGIPTERKFRSENCAVFSYELMRLSPDQGAIVEIE